MAFLTVAAAVLAGCGTYSQSGLFAASNESPTSAPSDYVPWVATSGHPSTALPAPASAALVGTACAPGDLQVSGVQIKGEAGSEALVVTVSTTAAAGCDTPTQPADIGFQSASGASVSAPVSVIPSTVGSSAMPIREGAPLQLVLVSPDTCPQASASSSASSGAATSMNLTMAAGEILTVPVPPGFNTCAITSWGLTSAAPVTPTPNPPLLAQMELPVQPVQPGDTVTYYVTVTNSGTASQLASSNCPSYEQTLSSPPQSLVDQWLQLNCTGGALAIGSSRTFEMEILVPADAPSGPAKVTWTIPSLAVASGGSLSIS